MADIRETYVAKEPGLGGRYSGLGGRHAGRVTLWLSFVISASLIAVVGLYLVPQFW